jgi:formylglycine-generating enzyme required for sulfatase activity
MNKLMRCVSALGVLLVCNAVTSAVTIDLVNVGNPNNPGELSGSGGLQAIVGGVGYTYDIGKYEITAGQYTEFLNAVAADDTYSLYNPSMWSDSHGCKIQRSGSPGSYSYSVASSWADHPVNYVSFWDASRFVNWLENGQPTGPQGPTTTEDGAYTLNGYLGSGGAFILRNPDANWVIPTEDEWYKAAYHKNDGATANFWDYPTGTDAVPNNGNPEGDTGNSANFRDSDGYAFGFPFYRSVVGFFAQSDSPYGTFDQGGNVFEWNETRVFGGSDSRRGSRGGSWLPNNGDVFLHANYRAGVSPSSESMDRGFRVALVPAPSALAFLILGVLGARRRGRP